MIKCYIVTAKYDNNDVQTRGGKFIKRRDYIAKVSNKEAFSVMVLDENHNWIPFDTDCGCMRMCESQYSFEKCFDIDKVFFAKNKKSLNELFGKDGSQAFKYATALKTLYDDMLDHRLFTCLAYRMGDDSYKNKFII